MFGPLGFGDPVVGQATQNPVDTGQADPHRRVVADLHVDLLGAAESVAAAQNLQDGLLFGSRTLAPRCRALTRGVGWQG